MKYKLDENGNIAKGANGQPVLLIDKEGKTEEIEVDAIHLLGKIPSLQAEAKDNRLKAADYKKKLDLFGDLDPDKSRKALDITANLDDKKLVDAEEMEKLKTQLGASWETKLEQTKKGYTGQIEEMQTSINKKDSTIFGLMVSSKFASSPYFAGENPKTNVMPEMAESYFGKNFKVEDVDGALRVVGYQNGEKIYSRKKMGDLADFNESLDIILQTYDKKENIMKPSSGGGGAGSTTFSDNGKVIKISADQASDPAVYRQVREQASKEGKSIQIT